APRLEVVVEEQIADRRWPVGKHPFEVAAIEPLELQQDAEEGQARAQPFAERWLRQFGRIVLVTWVQKYEAGNVRRKALRKAARVDAPQRVADEDVRRRHAGDAQQGPEFIRDLGCAAWKFSVVAPPGPRAVVKHGRRKPGGLLVEIQIAKAGHAGSRQKNHDRTSAARGVEHQLPSPNVVEPG